MARLLLACLALAAVVAPALAKDAQTATGGMGGGMGGAVEGTASTGTGASMVGAMAGGMGAGMDMSMGAANITGSQNMEDPCYKDPSDPSCADFMRDDADLLDDLSQLCDAMPFMAGCTLARQCEGGTANGTYCTLCSLVANICADMPGMKGCEAYNALCAVNSTVQQCTSPGPVPGVVMTFTIKDGIDSLCGTHCMPGCMECYCNSPGHSFAECTDPLAVLAYQCYAMPGMPECAASGLPAMCANAEVASTFPAVCGTAAEPEGEECPANYFDACESPALPPAASPDAAAPPPQPASGAQQAPAGAGLLAATLLAALAAMLAL